MRIRSSSATVTHLKACISTFRAMFDAIFMFILVNSTVGDSDYSPIYVPTTYSYIV